MPMLMRLERLLKASPLARRLGFSTEKAVLLASAPAKRLPG